MDRLSFQISEQLDYLQVRNRHVRITLAYLKVKVLRAQDSSFPPSYYANVGLSLRKMGRCSRNGAGLMPSVVWKVI